MRDDTIREIEFRGRDKRHDGTYGPWFYGWYIDYDIFHEIHDKKGIAHSVEPETVGQWTGLLDKNGVRIFEGDVIDAKHSIIEVQSVVKFDEKKAVFCMWGSSDWTPLYEWTDFKVVGNIFDDELLKRRWEWIYFHEPTGPIEGETRITMTISDPESIKRLCEILKDK